MTVFDVDIDALTGDSARLDQYRGSSVLVVNVAGRCGMTDGTVAGRFSPRVAPDDPELIASVEKQLPR
jgi:glutathione peroxidase-family protein